jgi:hypothetical protein
VTGGLEQVCADGVDSGMAGEGRVGFGLGELLQAVVGPWTMAFAAMRLRVTIGPGAMVSSSSYSARICGQSVSW